MTHGVPKGHVPTGSPWTEENVLKAKRLRSAGRSAAEIATAIGGVSRNAVIGVLHRAGLTGGGKSGRPSKPGASAPPKTAVNLRQYNGVARKAATARVSPPVPLPKLRVVAAASRFVCLVDLKRGQCRYVTDDPGPGRMDHALFCGANTGGETYCPAHRSICFYVSKYTHRELTKSVRRYA